MHRFYCPDLQREMSVGQAGVREVMIDGSQAYHARRVLRLVVRDLVEVFDGRGGVAEAEVVSWGEGKGAGAMFGARQLRVEPPIVPSLHLGVSLPKGSRADGLAPQLSQIGVDRLIPMLCERSVAEPRSNRLERYRVAAIESAKQCGRAYLLEIGEVAGFEELLHGYVEKFDLVLLAVPGVAGVGASDPLADLGGLHRLDRVLILIGPEGGWSSGEIEMARSSGCVLWTLGPCVMRTETAAVAAASIAAYLAWGRVESGGAGGAD